MVIRDLGQSHFLENIYKLNLFCKYMNNKRGQITIFVIIGVVLLILVGLGYYLYNVQGLGIAPQIFLGNQMQPVKENAMECINSVSDDVLNNFGLRGGVLSPDNYLLYKGDMIAYLCSNLPGDNCLNHLRTKKQIEDEMMDAITTGMNDCVDKNLVGGFLAGYDYNFGSISSVVEILDDRILVNVDYPVTMSKSEITQTLDPLFLNRDDIPLGGMYDVVYDILQQRAVGGDFETIPYMLENRGEFEIMVDKPYPDEVYIIKPKAKDYTFQFAIEGVDA